MAGGQNHATMRVKLKSALAHKKLANQILDQIKSTQTKWNATLDKLNADAASLTPAVPEVTDITCVADVADSLNNTYFFLNEPVGNGHYVWFNVSAAGVNPGPFGSRTGVEVAIATNDNANTVAAAVQAAVDPLGAYAATVLTDTVTVTNSVAGAVVDASAQTSGFTVSVDTQGANAIAGLDTNYSSSGALSDLFSPDSVQSNSQHKSSLRKSLRSALAHKKLADEICDSLVAMQSKYNSLLTKLDAEAGTLNDVNYASTLSLTVISATSSSGVENQHKASRRTSLRSALAHRNLADELLSAISGFGSSFNAVLAKLDLATINGAVATHKVSVIAPDVVS